MTFLSREMVYFSWQACSLSLPLSLLFLLPLPELGWRERGGVCLLLNEGIILRGDTWFDGEATRKPWEGHMGSLCTRNVDTRQRKYLSHFSGGKGFQLHFFTKSGDKAFIYHKQESVCRLACVSNRFTPLTPYPTLRYAFLSS